MNKQEIIDALNAAGVTFDPAQSKAELLALLPATGGKPGDAAASESTPAAPTDAADAKPAGDSPPEAPPAPPAQAPQAEAAAIPSPFPHLVPDEHWNGTCQAEFETMLREKTAAGLSKKQALEVIESQIRNDLARGGEG